MTTKEKIRGVTHLPYGLRHLVLGIVATLTITLSVSAQSFASFPGGGGGSPPPPPPAAAPKGAKCAILDQGLVTCPAGVKANACYYKDLGNPDPKGSVNGFVEAPSCDNGIFKAAETPQITASEDPALTQCKSASSCDLVKKYVDPLINVLAAAVGVVVTISIVVGGIQYASSAGDPGKAQAARKRIMNAIIALIGFFLFYAVLQWLVPGGLLNG